MTIGLMFKECSAAVIREHTTENRGMSTGIFRQRFVILLVTMSAVLSSCHQRSEAHDWPQWRGPQRDAVSTETGLLQSWTTDSPKVLWNQSALGIGYSSIVLGETRLFTMGRKESDLVVTAMHVETGEKLWEKTIGKTSRHPTSTPTLDGDYLFVLDPDGELVCLKSSNGDFVWQSSFVDDFGGRMMSGRGYGESPLVDGDRLICTPGGPDAVMVAFEKRTGHVLWKASLPENVSGPSGKDGAGFSSIVISEAAGIRQYVQLVGRGLIGIDARDGRLLWSYNDIANGIANIPTPIVYDDFVFAANGYTAGSVLLKLVSSPDANDHPGVTVEVIYSLSGSQFQNHHGGLVRLGEFVYGGHGNNNGLPTCLELKTGRIVWRRRGPGVGSAAVVYADGHLYFRFQNGVMALIEATDHGLVLKGTFDIPGAGADSWSHPVVANGRLYLREQELLWAYNLRPHPVTNDATPSKHSPNANSALTARQGIGVAVAVIPAATSTAAVSSHTLRGCLEYSLASKRENHAEAAVLVSLTNADLTPQGTLSDAVLQLLADLKDPLIVSLAGTLVSDTGLRQLQPFKICGLNLELCSRITDVSLKHENHSDSLRALVLTGTGITSHGLKGLAIKSNLVALDLELCDGVTDEATDPLGELTQLKFLSLKKTGFERDRISDKGLKNLQRLDNLELLNLYGNRLTNVGLEYLQAFQKLHTLNLSLLAISDAGLEYLKPLRGLERLDLTFSEGFSGPILSDDMVDSLLPLSSLTTLDLTGAKLSDEGLKKLQRLKSLKTLRIVRTKTSDSGIREFQKAVPECNVFKE